VICNFGGDFSGLLGLWKMSACRHFDQKANKYGSTNTLSGLSRFWKLQPDIQGLSCELLPSKQNSSKAFCERALPESVRSISWLD
jgi:hypothetical protein